MNNRKTFTVNLTEKQKDVIVDMTFFWTGQGKGFITLNHGKVSERELTNIATKMLEAKLKKTRKLM